MKTKRQTCIPLITAPAVIAVLLLSASPGHASYQTTVLADNPLAYYPLDITLDPTGTTATDLSGHGNNGTYNGSSPEFNTVPGPSAFIPNALQFDGGSSFVDLSTGSNPSLLNFAGQITLEAWAQPANSTSFGDIFAKGYDSTSGKEIYIRVDGPYGAKYEANSGSQGVSGGHQDTNWVHVVLANDGANTSLYLNGNLVQSTPDAVGAVNFADTWAIGDGTSAGVANRFFNGNICQVALYNHGLSADTVFNHFFIGKYGVSPGSSIPIITNQPASQVSYTNGTTIFSVGLLGVLPTTNQWYRNSSPLSGQTNTVLILSNLQPGDAGSYRVTSGNSNGSTNSASATLTLDTITAYEKTVAADSPLAYYPLDSNIDSSPLAQDLSGNGNFGLYQNVDPVANHVSGPSAFIPNGVGFNGASLVDLSAGVQPGLLNFAGPITMEAWVQPADSTSFGDIMAKGYDSSSYQETVIRVNGPYGANYYASSGSAGINGGQQNTVWTHVVLSSDGAHCNFYINGVLIQSVADTSGSQLYSDSWAIGDGTSAGNTRFFNGNICQVAIYKHGLTTNQVLQHFFMGAFGKSPSNSIPIISAQPQPQSVYAGGTATFSVGVVGILPTTNLWFRNGSPLAGQTNTTLVVANVQTAANYSVVIGNSIGATNSAPASLTVLASGNSLLWTITNNNGIWDSGNSANWVNVSNSQQVVFNNGDKVMFDDTPGVPTTVTINGSVSPSGITVASDNNAYTLANGPGTITGAGGLVKQGASVLTVLSSGNFTGPVTISGGSIYAGNNSFGSVGSITITNNSTLDIAGGTYTSGQPVTISGTGVNGQGALFNSYGDYPSPVYKFTLAGDTTFGASARWDLGSGSSITGAHQLILDWSAGSGYGEWNTVTVGTNVAGITLTNGNLGLKYMDTGFQNPATPLTVSPGSQLTFWNGGYNGSLHILSGGLAYLWTAPAAFNGSSIILEDSAQWQSFYNSGDEPINSAVTLNGVAHIVVGDHNMIYTNVISGPGGFVFDYYNHAMVLSAADTYTGPTIIGSGPEVNLTGNGSVAQSSLIFFGGSNPGSTHMDVTGRPDKTLTLASGQTLAGIGAIAGNLTVAAGATVAPAGTNTTIGITAGSNPTGTIAATNIILHGITILKLNGTGTNDALQATGNINYGGTLSLVNIGGAPLALGDSFQVFSAASYSGSFGSITPTPGAGLAWSPITNGRISVVTAQPIIGSTKVSGGQLIFTGTGGNLSGTYYVLATTNLAAPISGWTVVSTNQFDASGNFSVTNAISAGAGHWFYTVKE